MKKLLLILTVLFVLTSCSMNENNTIEIQTTTQNVYSETIQVTEIATESISSDIGREETATLVAEKETGSFTMSLEIPNDGKLVRILDYIPDAFIDLRYASTNNFTGIVLYDDPEAYLCYGTVKKLINVQNELKDKGYSILIWDGYRSPEAQQRLWDAYPDPTFVADPRNGLTSHSRGNTIDIAIVHTDGSPVELPSKFDEFSAVADRDYSDVSDAAASNARLLEDVMYNNGFTGYKGEWWDYSDKDIYVIEPATIVEKETGDEYLIAFLENNNYTFSDISESNQLILVISSSTNCKVFCYEKKDDNWGLVFGSDGIVGKNGTTDSKCEGDYCTPKGLYSLGFAFGTEPLEVNMEYRLINNNCYWVDDPQSQYYNQWIETSEKNWNSAEHLIDYPQSYHYGIVINYNTAPIVSYAGSAIFLHCMTGTYTAGCVAIPESDMIYILNWLSSVDNPIVIIE